LSEDLVADIRSHIDREMDRRTSWSAYNWSILPYKYA